MEVISKNDGRFQTNQIPHNKGKRKYEKEIERFVSGQDNHCEKHGWHLGWYRQANEIKCKKCACVNAALWAKNNPLKSLLIHSKGRKNRENNLTYDFLKALYDRQAQSCALTKFKFDNNDKHLKVSLDRIDNSRGYTMDNVQLVAMCVNRMKSSLSQSDFIELCKRISDYDKNRKI